MQDILVGLLRLRKLSPDVFFAVSCGGSLIMIDGSSFGECHDYCYCFSIDIGEEGVTIVVNERIQLISLLGTHRWVVGVTLW